MFLVCSFIMVFIKFIWGKEIMIANYLQNWNPTKALNEQFAPYQSWTKVKLDLSELMFFNC